MNKISVIIPIYNMGTYIAQCIDNVMSQTLKEIEVICIDDGSTDNTPVILRELKNKYSNLVIERQENQGSGSARNRGILLAQGEFIAFMDADDFYPENDVLEVLYNAAKQNEALICGGSGCNYRNGVFTYDGLRKGFVYDKDGWIDKGKFQSFGGYWRFIYNRNFLLSNKIVFPDYLRCQDPPFFLRAVAKAEKVYCIKKYSYCYRKEHKKEFFSPQKALDYAKGMRDGLMIAEEEGMQEIASMIVKDIHGELSALMYQYASQIPEMSNIIHDFNKLIKKANIGVELLLYGNGLKQYLEQIEEEKNAIFENVKNYPLFLIFGAGTIGRKVQAFFRNYGVKPNAFVVSDIKQNAKEADGIQVKCIDEYIPVQEKCMIIIATFPYLHDEIRNSLEEKGFRNYYPIDLEKFYLFQDSIIH